MLIRELIQIYSENKMNRILLISTVFCIFFAGCASVQKADNTAETATIKPAEPKYGLLVTPKGTEIIELGEPGQKEKTDPAVLFEKANRLFDQKRLEEAVGSYAELLETSPESEFVPFSSYNLGLIAIKQSDWRAAEKNFRDAYSTLKKPQDKTDALLNWLEAARNVGLWEKISETGSRLISEFSSNSFLSESDKREISLRYAESLIMTGQIEEGRRLADFWRLTILKENPRHEAVYIPELALAYFVLGRSFVKEFSDLKLDETTETLEEKCRRIVEAQAKFLKAINVGVIFWTNASAFEAAKLYTDLYTEMNSHPVPDDLTDEEKSVYECELWKKISNLLKKSRRTLIKSVDAAKKINEENEYIEMSLKMVSEIDSIYEEKENICKNM